MLKIRKKTLFIVLIFLVFSSSCVPTKRLAYVQSDRSTRPSQMVYSGPQIDNTIKPRDEIYVRITSADDNQVIGVDQRGGTNPILYSYTVSEDGTVKLPFIGKIEVVNLTIEEASDKIEKALAQFLFMPSVYMRFINNKVTVLGEVNTPGVYTFDRKNINILEAVGYARDITQFGNRRNVLLIRESGVTRSKHYIDLTSSDLFRSEYYLIQPDDIIYVEPLGRKKWGIGTVPYNLLFSAITTFLVVYNFVKTN
jgi:polysaccharide biosynthesis/export protein